MEYEAPSFQKDAFNCPLCNAYAQMSWTILSDNRREVFRLSEIHVALCSRCKEDSYWLRKITPTADDATIEDRVMLYPTTSSVPTPHPDLLDDCKINYDEARTIAALSPRGAGALLRLTLEDLLISEIPAGNNMNGRIKKLVKEGLPEHLQQALDYVRVTGTASVHAGDLKELNLDIRDTPERVMVMFKLINMIVEEVFAKPKHISELYSSLPEDERAKIAKRDNTS
ncbi:MAG: DUF4145 domain-containing protein [Burkholderiaceae bacterium]|jgi:hypothetical protein|nr:DUF4145 domain-containing protein [Burkholderiaceae bacterium]